MKSKTLLTLLVVILTASSMYAQKTVQILGTTFTVRCNNDDMTAEICDYDYRIDDHEFPMYKDVRRTKHKLHKKTLTIPETVVVDGSEYLVTSIGRAAFADYRNFRYVNIPNTVTNIGEYAFFRTPLVEVEIPTSVISIGNRAFGRCPKLKKIQLPYSGVKMGSDVYAESKNIAVSIVDGGAPLMATNNAVQPQPLPKAQPKKAEAKPTIADVDMNIPPSFETIENTLVVIITNENYEKQGNSIANVRHAIHDGDVFKKYCITTLGIPEKYIKVEVDATLNKMRGRFDWLEKTAATMKGKARVIVYYAGHGIPDDQTRSAYLLPVDGVGNDAESGYSLKALYDKLGKIPAQSVTVFMDACFSGAQRGDGMLASSRGVAIAAKEEVPTGNLVVFSAAQKDETAYSYDEMGHGLFTYFLLKKLQESEGNVTYQELADYLTEKVSLHSNLVNDKQQTPSVSWSVAMDGKLKNMKLK